VQLPVSVAPGLSGPPYAPDVHEATPEVASDPLKRTATGRVYQPFESGGRSTAGETLGGVRSMRTVTVNDTFTPPGPVALQVTFVPLVSLETVTGFGAHMVTISVPTKVTVTADRYQPLQLLGPGEQEKLRPGAAAAGPAPAIRRAAKPPVHSAAVTMEVRPDNVLLRHLQLTLSTFVGGGQSEAS
jgi:hypothetical protein